MSICICMYVNIYSILIHASAHPHAHHAAFQQPSPHHGYTDAQNTHTHTEDTHTHTHFLMTVSNRGGHSPHRHTQNTLRGSHINTHTHTHTHMYTSCQRWRKAAVSSSQPRHGLPSPSAASPRTPRRSCLPPTRSLFCCYQVFRNTRTPPATVCVKIRRGGLYRCFSRYVSCRISVLGASRWPAKVCSQEAGKSY
jgi:hypothetical protein